MNERQRRFIAEYLVDFNGAHAAARVGYTKRHAARTAVRLLRHPEIAAEIAKAKEAQAAQRRVTADRVLLEYARIAYADMRDFVDWGPAGMTLRPKDKIGDWEAGAIADVVPAGRDGKSGRIRLHDKKAALDALARHLGLFSPNASMGKEDQSEAAKQARIALRERLLRLARGEG